MPYSLVVFFLPNLEGQIATSFLLLVFFFGSSTVLDPHRHRSGLVVGHAIVMLSMFSGTPEKKVNIDGDDGCGQEGFWLVLVSFCNVLTMILFLIAEAFRISLLVVQELRTRRQCGGRVGGRG